MKKKTLLLTLLALAIVTSLTAGTLAVYTKSVDLGADVQVKKFIFNADFAPQFQTTDIKFAPGESRNYTFEVSNFKEKTRAEIPLDFDLTFDFRDAAKSMQVLTPKLTKNGSEVKLASSGGFYTYATDPAEPMQATKDNTDKYVLTLKWVDDGKNDSSHTASGETAPSNPLKIKVTATQNTTKIPDPGTNP